MVQTPSYVRRSRNSSAWARGSVAALGILVLLLAQAGMATAQGSAAPPVPAASMAPLPSPLPDALKVVTTTSVFADIVRNVAREHAAVTSIIPAGVGPEDYEPTPADAHAARRC